MKRGYPGAAAHGCSKTRQRGFTIASFALMLAALMGMAALAIDVGVLYTARTSAQHAADAAALAAAFEFANPGVPSPTTAATNAAIAIAGQNKILGQAVTPGQVAVTFPGTNLVAVTVSRTGASGVATFFAKVLGVNVVNVSAKATAEAWQAGMASACLKPIFLTNTVLSTAPDNATACARGEVLFTPGTYQLSGWGNSVVPSRSPVTIRPTAPSGALMPSDFYSLDFGSGGNTYRCAIGQCLSECGVSNIACGDPLPIETGDMKGPTKQGVDDLIGSPPDTWIGPGQYDTGSGVIADTSRALVVAPVWDSCDPANALKSGKKGQTVKVVGFVTAFVSGMSGTDVKAYIVGRTECAGSGVSGANGNATGPYGIPVRLVQNP